MNVLKVLKVKFEEVRTTSEADIDDIYIKAESEAEQEAIKEEHEIKEHTINDIKELKENIILINDMLKDLRIIYITNKGKYDNNYDTRCFFENLQNFIDIEIINIDSYYRKYTDNAFALVNRDRVMADKLFSSMYYKIEDALIHTILIKEKKIKCYENLMELYSDKPVIKDIIELYPKNNQYSMITNVIFIIMIVIYVITLILLIIYFTIYNNYNSIILYNFIQTFKNIFFNEKYRVISTRFIEKYNKLKDLIKNTFNIYKKIKL